MYRGILAVALKLGLNASDLKLITAIIMVVILSGIMDKLIGLIKWKGVTKNVATRQSIKNI